MEDLEIIAVTPVDEGYKNLFANQSLALRKPVWLAMSEIWLHEDMSDYDLNYIAIRLADSPFQEADLENIFHQEVKPVVCDGHYIMDNDWYVIEANWLEDSILKYLYAEKIKQDTEGVSKKLLKKISRLTGKNGASKACGNAQMADKAESRWLGIIELIRSTRAATQISENTPAAQPFAIDPTFSTE